MKIPELNYGTFSDLRDTIQKYTQLVSSIKSHFAIHQKNWEEFSLKFFANGLTTSPIPIKTKGGYEALELIIDFTEHKLIALYKNVRKEIGLEQESLSGLTNLLADNFDDFGINRNIIEERFFANEKIIYDKVEVVKFLELLRSVYFLLNSLKASTLFETSGINLWSHHLDIALLIFSGKLIEGENPENWDHSRQQMNFGLSFGDAEIHKPYFYATAYPFDDSLLKLPLPEFAERHTLGWNGFIIKLDKISDSEYIETDILNLFKLLIQKNFGLEKLKTN